ncbi:transmembrane protein 272 isoform X2 [Python bivittatus]|uniref:Transmembrane protein 272 isoform X2 n=1 Tax=Python bivittatus TaxID=176946 RepID=A0A9F5IS64_PYTBI|nr:transmembrane protein 272 isoform X2 [Python bivittatus]
MQRVSQKAALLPRLGGARFRARRVVNPGRVAGSACCANTESGLLSSPDLVDLKPKCPLNLSRLRRGEANRLLLLHSQYPLARLVFWAPSSSPPQAREACRKTAWHSPAAMAEESQSETLLLRATEEPSSVHSVLMVLGKLLFAVLAVAGIVIGIVYFSQCPRQPPLPVYVVILGIVTLLLLFLSCIPCGDGTNRPSTLLSCFRAAGFLFLCAWFIAGNVWVYSIYPPDYEAVGHPDFCQRTLFLFAFGVTTAIHMALAVALLLALGILAVILILNAMMPYGRHNCPGGP